MRCIIEGLDLTWRIALWAPGWVGGAGVGHWLCWPGGMALCILATGRWIWEGCSVGTGGEGMGQGLREHQGLSGLTQAFIFPSISRLCYLFIINTFLWNKMGTKLKVIIPILALHHRLTPSNITQRTISHVYHLHQSSLTSTGSHTDTGVQAHAGWAHGLENTDWLCSDGIWRFTLFFLCSTSGSRIRELFLEDGYIYTLEIIALPSGSVKCYHPLLLKKHTGINSPSR